MSEGEIAETMNEEEKAERMDEEEIARGTRMLVGGRAPCVSPKTTNSLNNKGIEGLPTRARPVCDAGFWIVFLAPADMMTLAGNQDQSWIRTEGASDPLDTTIYSAL